MLAEILRFILTRLFTNSTLTTRPWFNQNQRRIESNLTARVPWGPPWHTHTRPPITAYSWCWLAPVYLIIRWHFNHQFSTSRQHHDRVSVLVATRFWQTRPIVTSTASSPYLTFLHICWSSFISPCLTLVLIVFLLMKRRMVYRWAEWQDTSDTEPPGVSVSVIAPSFIICLLSIVFILVDNNLFVYQNYQKFTVFLSFSMPHYSPRNLKWFDVS